MPGDTTAAVPERIAPLEGVRALAVTAVLVYHLGAPWLPGGFLGVDVFFVLSGFLITRLLLRELDATGRISLTGFWSRRARRLLPAVLTLLAVVSVYAATRPAEQQLPLRRDLISSLLYVTNWQFVIEGRSYFSEFQAPSPLRHLWSLAIEEQFYLVFPIMMMAVFLAIRRFPARGEALVLVSSCAVFIGSVVSLAVLFDEADPSRAYYSTFTRLHELLTGAGVAVLLRPSGGRHTAFARPMALAGAAALVACFFLIDDRGALYYHGGSVAVCAASAALVAGLTISPGSGVTAWLLSRRAPVAVGEISYGLYLWHWPVIVVLTPESTRLTGPLLLVTRITVALGVSIASYHLIEKPIRSGAVRGHRLDARRTFTLAGATVLVLCVTAFATTVNAEPEPGYVKQSEGLIVPRGADPRLPVIGLVGDSIAASLQEALGKESVKHGHTLVSAARPGCGIGTSLLLDETGHPFSSAAVCAERTPRLQDELVSGYHPRVILWHSARDRTDVRVGDRTLRAGSAAWREQRFSDWDAALGRLVRGGAHVVLLLPAWSPTGSADSTCGGEFNLDPVGCDRPFVTTEHLRRLYTTWAGRHPGDVTIMDLGHEVCPAGPPCPNRVGGERIREDEVHFSPSGAAMVAPRIIAMALTRP